MLPSPSNLLRPFVSLPLRPAAVSKGQAEAATNKNPSTTVDINSKQHVTKGKKHSINRQRHSPLIRLPGELRNLIYEYATYTDGKCQITKTGGVPEPALLMTCKKIRKEATCIYYANNTAVLESISFDAAAERLFFRKYESLLAGHEFELATPGMKFAGPPNWTNLKGRLRSCHGVHSFFTSSDTRLPPALIVAFGMMRAVMAMQARPWEEVESILESLRAGLVAIDSTWAST